MNDYISFGYRPSKMDVLKQLRSMSNTDTAIGHALSLACDNAMAKLLVPKLPPRYMKAMTSTKRKKTTVPSSVVYNHRTHQYEAKEYYLF